MGYINMEKRWLFPLIITSLASIFLLATSFNMNLISSLQKFNSIFSIIPSRHHHVTNQTRLNFAESKLSRQQKQTRPHEDNLPRFAYLVSGSKGDIEKLWRTLRAVYHPRNHYVVHLDLESPLAERLELASRINKDPMYVKTGNVYMITKANLVTYRGPTMVANTLHACAVLLKRSANWDWFINLSASDYPLVTQDDLLHTFSTLDRNLNFIEHTSDLGWKEEKRAMPVMIDPGLYLLNKSDIYWVTPRRTLPTAFKLFTASHHRRLHIASSSSPIRHLVRSAPSPSSTPPPSSAHHHQLRRQSVSSSLSYSKLPHLLLRYSDSQSSLSPENPHPTSFRELPLASSKAFSEVVVLRGGC